MPYGDTGRSGASSVSGRPSFSPYTAEVDAATVGIGRQASAPSRGWGGARFCRTDVGDPAPPPDPTPRWPAGGDTHPPPPGRGAGRPGATSAASTPEGGGR